MSATEDASIWEDAKLKGATALSKLVNDALANTSVTCVLIGTETYQRTWVRYEIARSFARGNALIGIHINGVKDKYQNTANLGKNPFDYIRYEVRSGTVYLYEWANKNGTMQWIPYSKLPNFPKSDLKYSLPDSGQLSGLTWIYEWIKDDGYNKLGTWANAAALARGR